MLNNTRSVVICRKDFGDDIKILYFGIQAVLKSNRKILERCKIDTITRNNLTHNYRAQLDPALDLSSLGCSSTHNITLQVLQRTALGPAPPKTGPA